MNRGSGGSAGALAATGGLAGKRGIDPSNVCNSFGSGGLAPTGAGGSPTASGSAGMSQGGLLTIPACSGISDTGDSVATPAVYWSFDGVSELSTADTAYTLTPGAEIGEVPTTDHALRLNGSGSSILLSGNQYFSYTPQSDDDPTLLLNARGGTISVWLSIPQDGLPTPNPGGVTVWPILSTVGEGTVGSCGGYQLDLRLDCANGPEVAFSYQHLTGSSRSCETEIVELPLDVPSWGWGSGRWHHLAAVLRPQLGNQSAVSLYWDVDSIAASRSKTSLTNGHMALAPAPAGLCVGATGCFRSSSPASKFVGNIDDIALFTGGLTSSELAQFSLHSTTVGNGPGRCRWRVSEVEDDSVSAERSTAWKCGSSNEHIEMAVQDGDWGAGVLAARVAPPGLSADLSTYGQVVLTAGIPAAATPDNGSFEFSLHSGDDSCTWNVLASTSQPADYSIDLNHPTFCQASPTRCGFPLDSVEWVSVRSSIEYPLSWIQPLLGYVVYGIDFVQRPTQLAPSPSIGGTLGPGNVCWRTEAFQVGFGGRAELSRALDGSVMAAFAPNAETYSALVIDLGDDTVDLSSCNGVSFAGDFSGIDTDLKLVLQDGAGLWEQWNLGGDSNVSRSANLHDSPTLAAKGFLKPFAPGRDFYPWAGFPPTIDRTSIAYIKIQKNTSSKMRSLSLSVSATTLDCPAAANQ